MKSTTFARFALFLPYITLIVAGGYLYLHKPNSNEENILVGINILWVLLAVLWFIPYSILLIYLLNWSRRKTIEEIQSTYTYAPFTMMFITITTYLTTYVIVSIYNRDFFQSLGLLVLTGIISVPANLLFGYIFVSFSMLLYKLLQKINFIRD